GPDGRTIAHIRSSGYHEALSAPPHPAGGPAMRRTVAVLAVLLLASLVHAQDTASWVGKRVVIKYKQPLRFGQVAVEPKEYRAYTVAQAEGDQLLLTAGGVSGWIRRDDI